MTTDGEMWHEDDVIKDTVMLRKLFITIWFQHWQYKENTVTSRPSVNRTNALWRGNYVWNNHGIQHPNSQTGQPPVSITTTGWYYQPVFVFFSIEMGSKMANVSRQLRKLLWKETNS